LIIRSQTAALESEYLSVVFQLFIRKKSNKKERRKERKEVRKIERKIIHQEIFPKG